MMKDQDRPVTKSRRVSPTTAPHHTVTISHPPLRPPYAIMTSVPSIYKLKSDFLASQARNLSRLPDPPRNWQDKLEPTEHGDISDHVLNQVLYKRLSLLHLTEIHILVVSKRKG